jgi:hypothetical protein
MAPDKQDNFGGEATRAVADAHAMATRPAIEAAVAVGIESLAALAVFLNEQGIATPQGGAWHPESVRRVVRRLDGMGIPTFRRRSRREGARARWKSWPRAPGASLYDT